MIEITLNFAAEQTDHIVCIFMPSAAPHFPFFFFYFSLFSRAFSARSRVAQSKAAFLFIHTFNDTS